MNEPTPPSRPPDSASTGWQLREVLLVAAILVGGLVAVLFALTLFQDDDPTVFDVGVTRADVTDDPDTYVGERVVISGVVGERIADRAFTLDDELLVVGSLPQEIPDDSIAQVAGIVRRMQPGQLQSQFGIPADHEALEEGDQPVLVASSVQLSPLARATPASGEGLQTREEALTEDGGVLSVAQVLDQFERYEGTTVTLAGDVGVGLAEHVAVMGGLAFATEAMLLVTSEPQIGSFPSGASARATGMLTRFDPVEAERSLGIELDEELLSEHEDSPAMLVDSIEFFIFGRPSESLLDLVGQRVTLRSDIERVISDRMFTVDGGSTVVITEAPQEDLLERAAVTVTGTAEVFEEEHLNELLGTTFSADELQRIEVDELEGRPLVIASEIAVQP